MEKVTRLAKEERYQQILDAALSVFIEKGYSSTTTLEIAKAAQISEVTLFRYFSSKHEIFMAGISPVINESIAIMQKHNGNQLNHEALNELILNKVKFLSKHRGIIKLILNEKILNQEGENIIEKMVNNLSELMEVFGIDRKDPFYVRLLMGHFLSYLYVPLTSFNSIEEHTQRLVAYILER